MTDDTPREERACEETAVEPDCNERVTLSTPTIREMSERIRQADMTRGMQEAADTVRKGVNMGENIAQSFGIECIGEGWVVTYTSTHSVTGRQMEQEVFVHSEAMWEWIKERM